MPPVTAAVLQVMQAVSLGHPWGANPRFGVERCVFDGPNIVYAISGSADEITAVALWCNERGLQMAGSEIELENLAGMGWLIAGAYISPQIGGGAGLFVVIDPNATTLLCEFALRWCGE